MKRAIFRHPFPSTLLVAASAGSASACVEDLWPGERAGGAALGACLSPLAPALQASASEAGPITIGATDREVFLDDLNAQGHGTNFVGSVRLSHGAGTVELGCETLPLAVDQTFIGKTEGSFTALAVDGDRLYSLQFTCDDGRLSSVYYESTDGTPQAAETVTGSCMEFSAPARTRVQFPSLDLVLPRLLRGYTIEGAAISLGSDGRGTITIGDVSAELFALQPLSCSESCNTLRALIWDRVAGRVHHVHFYFEPGDLVTMSSTATLPGWGDPLGSLDFSATFTTP